MLRLRRPALRAASTWLIATGVTASLACVVLAVVLAFAARSDTIHRATTRMTQEADLLARQIDADLAVFDLALRETARLQSPASAQARPVLLELPLTARYVEFMDVLNEVGDVIADSRSNVSRPANFAGRDYFQDQLRSSADMITIGRPFGMGPGQHPAIPISRRLTSPDGHFAGVVVAGIRLSWLGDLLSHAPSLIPARITVRRDDGVILARWPADPDAVGRGAATEPAWLDYVHNGRSSTIDDAGDPHVFRRVGTSPLVLEVVLAPAGIGAGERAWLLWLPPLAFIPGFFVVCLSVLAYRTRLREHRIEAAARAAHEESMRLLATMSHELRTPLTAILGQAEMLSTEDGLTDRQTARIARLTQAGRLMRVVVNRVTDVARLDDRDTAPVVAPGDLDGLVRACTGMVEDEARKKGLRVITLIDPGAPERPTLAHDLLQQVLVNLLMNAVKFTGQGTIALRVRSISGGLRFEVVDTGPGIPAHKRRRLFRAYDRLDAPDSAAEGTGLGLSITERFVHRMGGRIGHEDNPGGGSLFWAELPLSEPDAIPEARQEVPIADISPEATGGLRVLLADDLDLTRSVTADYLRSAGHAVTEVPDGETAIEAVRTQQFDVVLTDMRMPIMDGLEATRRIRALGGDRGLIPVVLVTADLVALGQGASGQASVDLCLMKPFTRAELLTTVETAARGSRVPRPEPRDSLVLDRSVFAEMKDRVGEAMFATHVRAAIQRIEDLADLLERQGGAESTEAESAAHDLIGVSGLLGLTGLSTCLRRFDIATERGTQAPVLREAAREAVRALREGTGLRSETPARGSAPYARI